MHASPADKYQNFEPIWREEGFDGEPLADIQRLEKSDILSIFTRTSQNIGGTRSVVVLDFLLQP